VVGACSLLGMMMISMQRVHLSVCDVLKISHLCFIKGKFIGLESVCDDEEKITNYLYSIIVSWGGW